MKYKVPDIAQAPDRSPLLRLFPPPFQWNVLLRKKTKPLLPLGLIGSKDQDNLYYPQRPCILLSMNLTLSGRIRPLSHKAVPVQRSILSLIPNLIVCHDSSEKAKLFLNVKQIYWPSILCSFHLASFTKESPGPFVLFEIMRWNFTQTLHWHLRILLWNPH